MRKKKSSAPGWNIEQMLFNPPIPFKTPIGKLRQPIGCTSYVYEITNTENGMKYIGYHKEGAEIYTTSSTNKDFKEVLATETNRILEYEIVFWGSVKECEQHEYELLNDVKAASNPMYYNKWNGKPGIKKLNLELTNQLVDEIDDVRTFRNQKQLTHLDLTNCIVEHTVKHVYEMAKVQVRELEIDKDNLNKIIDKIRNTIGSYDMPVYFENVMYKGNFYEELLVSGNHTRTAMWETKDENKGHTEHTLIKCVRISEEIGQSLQESEMDILGNNLNADYSIGKAFSVGDAVQECLEHEKRGHSWKTIEMVDRFMRLGLTSSQVKNTVFNTVDDTLTKEAWKKAGKIVYDYRTTHADILREVGDSFRKNDDTFVIECSSGNPHLYRWFEHYYEAQYERIMKGLPVQRKFQVVVYHNSEKSQSEWPRLWKQLMRPHNLPQEYKGYVFNDTDKSNLQSLIKYPEANFYEMRMWGSKVQGKKIAS